MLQNKPKIANILALKQKFKCITALQLKQLYLIPYEGHTDLYLDCNFISSLVCPLVVIYLRIRGSLNYAGIHFYCFLLFLYAYIDI